MGTAFTAQARLKPCHDASSRPLCTSSPLAHLQLKHTRYTPLRVCAQSEYALSDKRALQVPAVSAARLQKLLLSSCGLNSIPPELCALWFVSIFRCRSVGQASAEWPGDFIPESSAAGVIHLDFEHCASLARVPGGLTSLEALGLTYCKALDEQFLPESSGQRVRTLTAIGVFGRCAAIACAARGRR